MTHTTPQPGPLPPTTAPRKAWVDRGKGLCMLLVVLFHSEIYFPTAPFSPTLVLGYAHMPFFFFLSGYVFTSCVGRFSLAHKVRSIVRSLLFTYFVFTALIVLPKSLMNGTPLSEGLGRIALGQASWFVTTLAVSELCYALLLALRRTLCYVPLFMVISVGAAWALKRVHPECLPYYIETALLENFFVGLGLLYRAHEAAVHRRLRVTWTGLAVLAIVYGAAFAIDYRWVGTPVYNYAVDGPYVNLGLYLIYATLGIAALTWLVKLMPACRGLCYVGRHSLIYYYLNGGAVRCVVYGLALAGIVPSPSWFGYPVTLGVAVCASLVLTAAAWAISRWCPFIAGDRAAFDRVSRRLGLVIRW